MTRLSRVAPSLSEEHPEEQDLRDSGPEHCQRDHRPRRLPTGHDVIGESGQGRTESAPRSHRDRRRCEGEAVGPSRWTRWPQRPPDRVREGRDHHRQRPGDAPPAAAWMQPREHADADQAEQDPAEPLRPGRASLGWKRSASRTTKIGTVAFAIAATPESMCFSPQAISVNGIAPLATPTLEPLPAERAQAGDRGVEKPRCARKTASSSTEGDHQPEHDHRRRLECAAGDLDEHAGRAPERRQGAI